MDVPIPDTPHAAASSISFGVLQAAQALGDLQALVDAGRRVLRIHLGQDANAGCSRYALPFPDEVAGGDSGSYIVGKP